MRHIVHMMDLAVSLKVVWTEERVMTLVGLIVVLVLVLGILIWAMSRPTTSGKSGRGRSNGYSGGGYVDGGGDGGGSCGDGGGSSGAC